VALAGLGYGLFALAWDGGTDRVTGDRILIGLAPLLAAGAGGMIARQYWGWILCAAVGMFMAMILGFYGLFRKFTTPVAPSATATLLQRLPGNNPQGIAAALGPAWWNTPIEELRKREHEDNAIARDWEIQGDGRTRLIVLTDLGRTGNGNSIPLNIFLLLNTGRGTVVRPVTDGFSSEDRDAPVELKVSRQQATVVVRGSACLSKNFALDHDAGAITPLADGPC